MHDVASLILALLIVLAAAKLLGAAAQRIGQPAVLGELLAGVLLGGSLLNVLHPTEPVMHALSELGVLVLLLEIGLHTSLRSLIRVGGTAAMVASVGVAVPFVAGYIVARVLGVSRIAGDRLRRGAHRDIDRDLGARAHRSRAARLARRAGRARRGGAGRHRGPDHPLGGERSGERPERDAAGSRADRGHRCRVHRGGAGDRQHRRAADDQGHRRVRRLGGSSGSAGALDRAVARVARGHVRFRDDHRRVRRGTHPARDQAARCHRGEHHDARSLRGAALLRRGRRERRRARARCTDRSC